MSNQPYETSAMYEPKVGRMHPDPALVAEAVERLAAAKRPIVLGGRGVLWSGARDAVIKLADRSGALLSNTLPARGLFHDHPFGLGITGSYFTALGREMYEFSGCRARGRHEPVLLRRWRALLAKGLQDPAR